MHKNDQSGVVFIPVLIIIALLAIGTGTAYYFTDGFGRNSVKESKTTKTSDNKAPANKNDQVNESAIGADTLPLVKAAINGQGSVKCTSNSKIEGKYAVSTMYIKDKDNIRLDIRTDMGTLNTLFLNQANSYTWSEGQDRGSKMALDKDDRTIEQQWQENIEDAKNNSELQGLSCGQTAVKDSLFVVPSSVTFSDLSQFN